MPKIRAMASDEHFLSVSSCCRMGQGLEEVCFHMIEQKGRKNLLLKLFYSSINL